MRMITDFQILIITLHQTVIKTFLRSRTYHLHYYPYHYKCIIISEQLLKRTKLQDWVIFPKIVDVIVKSNFLIREVKLLMF